MFAFITGSRAYGKVKPNSDIDLVIRVDERTAMQLRQLSDTPQDNHGVVVARFGRLNLMLCETDEQYAVWRVGTTQLCRQRPMEKTVVIKAFDALRRLVGIPDSQDSRQ